MTPQPSYSTTVGEPTAVSREAAIAALSGAYQGITETLAALPEPGFARPSSCAGWTVADVLHHLLLDAQRALVTCSLSTEAPPDTDYISYWAGYHADPGREAQAAAHARFVRISASAYSSVTGLLTHWTDTSQAAVRAASAAPWEARVATQGRVLTIVDFVATLAVEAAIHHLDLDLPGSEPDPRALALTRRTLDGLLGTGATRPDWPDTTYARKATGRMGLEPEDRATLGEAADRFPLFA